eukprot:CAMPEP_0116040622 /NCGR_PEP_ID=MMETSP0321-20121206/24481_1 /TAXON_ID=163516 /ORGANISM="Leptocylindrus danicus var. danicus, Strain B650" /LENGTH=430 /DNA_ID=CAMNT_0003520497 /DNA_START=266 /DNA_END=1554 /DNA_ORIENTATION=-
MTKASKTKYGIVARAFLFVAILTAANIFYAITYLHSQDTPEHSNNFPPLAFTKNNDNPLHFVPERPEHAQNHVPKANDEPNNKHDQTKNHQKHQHQLQLQLDATKESNIEKSEPKPSGRSHIKIRDVANFEPQPLDRMINDDSNPPSIRTLFQILKTHKPAGMYSEAIIDEKAEKRRCSRYGFQYDSTARPHRRRVFYGSNIANDSWHTIGSHAAEAYDLYHTAVLIESNWTQTLSPRRMRFLSNSNDLNLLQSGIFGPQTDVQIGRYIVNAQEAPNRPLLYENMQREMILQHWKDAGMTVDDIGLIGDVDEFFSRDALLAAMTCEIPRFKFRDCRYPRFAAFAMSFESSPNCIFNKTFAPGKPWTRAWAHPDMIIGHCVDGIGDAALHSPPAERDYGNGTLGFRMKGKGRRAEDWDKLPARSHYPLWKP